jgi:hypothetical protein
MAAIKRRLSIASIGALALASVPASLNLPRSLKARQQSWA